MADAPLPAQFLEVDPFTDDDLAAHTETAPVERVERWRPDTEAEAEWCARKLAAAEAEAKRVREQASEWRAQIDRWEQAELAPLERTGSWFRALLERWGLERRTDRRKSFRLPSATVSTRLPETGRVQVADPVAVLAWVESLPEAEREGLVKVEPRLSEVQKRVRAVPDGDGGWMAVSSDGERPAGFEVVPPEVSVTVKVNGS